MEGIYQVGDEPKNDLTINISDLQNETHLWASLGIHVATFVTLVQ